MTKKANRKYAKKTLYKKWPLFQEKENLVHGNKFDFRKETLHKKYGLPTELTERQMCSILKAYRIWNCGLLKYKWKRGDRETPPPYLP